MLALHRPVVFIPFSNGTLDFSDASRYGEIRIVMRREVYAYDIDEWLPKLINEAGSILSDFNHEHDFLCLAGSPMSIAVCAFILGSKPSINMLRYDRVERAYYSINVSREIVQEIVRSAYTEKH
jgi:hypothetical protein